MSVTVIFFRKQLMKSFIYCQKTVEVNKEIIALADEYRMDTFPSGRKSDKRFSLVLVYIV
jgi:hypothetical protein